MNMPAHTAMGEGTRTESERREIPESVAEDHARLLAMVGQCLSEIGIKASLTTFHKLVLRADTSHAPARYEPELDVFRSDEEDSRLVLSVKLAERDGKNFYCWGVSWAACHPASDPLGAVQVIADAVHAA
jgi:hypothetical protein